MGVLNYIDLHWFTSIWEHKVPRTQNIWLKKFWIVKPATVWTMYCILHQPCIMLYWSIMYRFTHIYLHSVSDVAKSKLLFAFLFSKGGAKYCTVCSRSPNGRFHDDRQNAGALMSSCRLQTTAACRACRARRKLKTLSKSQMPWQKPEAGAVKMLQRPPFPLPQIDIPQRAMHETHPPT